MADPLVDSLADPLFYARAIHFAATLLVAGAVFFVVFVAAPAWRGAGDGTVATKVRTRVALIAWISLALAVISGAVWLVLTAAAMSDRPPEQAFGVLWTVLSQTVFGRDWLLRLVLACALAATLPPLLSRRAHQSPWLEPAAVVLAAAFAGTLAWSGHAAGGLGSDAILHPAADALHLIAAAAWVGALPPLIVLFAAAGTDDASLTMARTATERFSILGIASVGTLLATGIVNTFYLVGSVPALYGTAYGRLLLIKIALFLAMVAIAAVNRFSLTPQLLQHANIAASRDALRRLRRHAAIEALAGATIIAIVAALGTMAPAIHAAHAHPTYEAVPADAAFVHIHLTEAMADVTIRPGRAGRARATIRLWNEDFAPLDARQVSLTLTAPSVAGNPTPRPASQRRDGAWQVDGIALAEPGNWTVSVGVVLGPTKRLTLTAPIVIEPGQ
ncbi:MAG TPA: copper homeostasis membrane protein CopD [Xanthobacteraceae bacterium]|nr:copper homeostasis membrane protein CopD [Xanthobacteraceae bacterium]